MTDDPPKRTAETAPNHVALVVRWQMQRPRGLQTEAELTQRKIIG
jgi:hypothetical protein